MARRKTIFHPGGYYHIYNRGANKQVLFRCPDNYRYLIKTIEKALSPDVSFLAYCLMPNHYHFLLKQHGEYRVNQFLQSVFNIYSKAYNKRYQRTGTLFEGPFKSVEIMDPGHLIHLCRYIHRNPLEAGLASDLRDWPYSNFTSWINRKEGVLAGLDFFSENFPNARAYLEFIVDSPSERKWADRNSRLLVDAE